MATTRLPRDFRELLQLLSAHEVEYLMVGGYAVGYHGYPRATVDMGVWVNRSDANAEKLVAVLKELRFDVEGLSTELFLKAGNIIRMGEPPLRIELIISASGVDFATCYRNRVINDIDGVAVNFISLEDLKRNKKAAGRYRDLDDLENLP